MLRALVQEGRKHKPRLDVHRTLPVFVVADPEAYRPTLVKRLHERARSLGDGRAVLLKSSALIGPSSSARSALIRWSCSSNLLNAQLSILEPDGEPVTVEPSWPWARCAPSGSKPCAVAQLLTTALG